MQMQRPGMAISATRMMPALNLAQQRMPNMGYSGCYGW